MSRPVLWDILDRSRGFSCLPVAPRRPSSRSLPTVRFGRGRWPRQPCAARARGHESWVTALALMPDGKKLISGSWDGTVRVWDVETGKADPILESHKSKIYSVAVSRDGKRAASGGGNGEVYLWDLESNSELAHLEGHDEETEVNGIAYTPDGKKVITGSADGEIRIWEVPSGRTWARLRA